MIDKDAIRFEKDYFAINQAGIKIVEAYKGYAKCEMAITPNHLNADGYVMGGAIFTLADFTCAIASNIEEKVTVTLNSSINFLNAANCKMLYAEAKPVKSGKAIAVFEVMVYDETDKLIAKYQGTGFRKN